ncbi:MAG: hypothetical protein ABIT61_04915 [Steroidobacteraceae bacterium]
MTARELFERLMANPTRPPFGFGTRPALINVDLQNAALGYLQKLEARGRCSDA